MEDGCRRARLGALCGAAQKAQESSQSADSEAAVGALPRVELKTPAAAPAHFALDVMREALLRPSVIITSFAKAPQSRSFSRARSVPIRRNRQLGAFRPTPHSRAFWRLD